MSRRFMMTLGIAILFGITSGQVYAIDIVKALVKQGAVEVFGTGAGPNANISWEGQVVSRANPGGVFNFSTTNLPQDCVGQLSDGVATIQVVIENCAILPPPPASFLATGQTTAFEADKDNGPGLDPIADDGTLQLGSPLQYVDNGDGTITDLNTGFMWEKKLSAADPQCSSADPTARDLHCANNGYRWSGNGFQETIWDWLDAVNAEGGTGFAGHNDWRVPNVRELQSIVDFGLFDPPIEPVFGPTNTLFTWSSTTYAADPIYAWVVSFFNGNAGQMVKTSSFPALPVRAVRGP